MQLIAFVLSLYLLRCGRTEIIHLKNLNFHANGAPNFEPAKYDREEKGIREDFSQIVDFISDEGRNAEVSREELEHSKVDNQIINSPKNPKLATLSEAAKNIQIIVIQPEDLNEMQLSERNLNELNLYKGLASNEADVSQHEISEIKAGAFLLGILSSLRTNHESKQHLEKPKELGFNIYVPISDDIVNPPFLPRESIEKIVHKNGLPLIHLKGDGMRITN